MFFFFVSFFDMMVIVVRWLAGWLLLCFDLVWKAWFDVILRGKMMVSTAGEWRCLFGWVSCAFGDFRRCDVVSYVLFFLGGDALISRRRVLAFSRQSCACVCLCFFP